MPIPPPPYTLRCPACGWKKTVVPLSDALRYGIEWFDCCPQCGHKQLEKTAVAPHDGLLARLKRLLGVRD